MVDPVACHPARFGGMQLQASEPVRMTQTVCNTAGCPGECVMRATTEDPRVPAGETVGSF